MVRDKNLKVNLENIWISTLQKQTLYVNTLKIYQTYIGEIELKMSNITSQSVSE